MKSLIIAPFPPPVSGNSLPVVTIGAVLNRLGETDSVNLSKQFHTSGFSLKRSGQLLNLCKGIRRKIDKCDLVYLTLAESFAGGFRDLCFYRIIGKKIDRSILHMFGGANMRRILRNPLTPLYFTNRYYLSRAGRIVVEGETQAMFFEKVASRDKIDVINNFASPELQLSEQEVDRKFFNVSVINCLFFSNMLYGKGHVEMAKAFLALPESIRSSFRLTFAGKLVSDENEFLRIVNNLPNISYIGPAYGEDRVRLFREAHVFCLPTYYPYEGQPFSIIEAYASGCCVLTTPHSGIPDIFSDKKNGFFVEKKSVQSIVDRMMLLPDNIALCREIAIDNCKIARTNYSRVRYEELFIKTVKSLTGEPSMKE